MPHRQCIARIAELEAEVATLKAKVEELNMVCARLSAIPK